MSNTHLERAKVLIDQDRYKDAEGHLKEAIAVNPEDGLTKTYLGLCLLELKKYLEAEEIINQAIAKSPDQSINYYLLAKLKLELEESYEAEKHINHAISIDPVNADYFGLLAYIKMDQRKWQEALDNANRGLEYEPDSIECLNARSTALVKLNKKDEAFSSIEEALHLDPDNPMTHSNYGWSELEKGKHDKALHHFQQALTLDPTSEHAKAGLTEALKARYLIYRWFLKYAFWISKLQGKSQWGFIIGFYVVFRVVKAMAKAAPFLYPIAGLLALMMLSTWLMEPLSNLFLRLNKYGKYALTNDEVKSSNYVGGSLVLGVVSLLIAYLLYRMNIKSAPLLIFGVACLMMMIPFSACFDSSVKNIKRLQYYTIGLASAGALSVVFAIINNSQLLGVFLVIFVFGIIGFQWVANLILIRK